MANTLLADTKQNKSLPFSNSLNRAQRGPIKFCLRSILQIKKNIQILFCFSPGQPLLPNPTIKRSKISWFHFSQINVHSYAQSHLPDHTNETTKKNIHFKIQWSELTINQVNVIKLFQLRWNWWNNEISCYAWLIYWLWLDIWLCIIHKYTIYISDKSNCKTLRVRKICKTRVTFKSSFLK